jgi:hypothetical protein
VIDDVHLREAHDAARDAHWRVDEIVVTLEGEEGDDVRPRAV